MFLLDKPFVSDFLIETIKDNNYKNNCNQSSQQLVKDSGMDSRRGSNRFTKKQIQKFSMLAIQRTLAWIDQYYGESLLSV
jgi:hypothetical protein